MFFSSKYSNRKCYDSLYRTGHRIGVIVGGEGIVPVHTTKKEEEDVQLH